MERQNNKGARTEHSFTLVEMLFYTAILSVTALLVVEAILPMISSFSKARVVRSANQQGTFVMDRLVRTIQLADGIDLTQSTFDASPGKLTLKTVDEPGSSTRTTRTFSVDSGALMLQEGSSTANTLTSGVQVTNLVFRNLALPAKLPDNGLVGHWTFDEGSGTTANDASGLGNNGTLLNMNSVTDWVSGKLGGALRFNGSNASVSIPHSSSINFGAASDTYSMALWFKAYPRPVYKGGSDAGGGSGQSIAVLNSYAYLGVSASSGTCNATTKTGCELQIYDVSDPASPAYVGGADTGGNRVWSIALAGHYAYLAVDLNNGTCNATTNTGCELQIYDVSNPTAPVYAGGADTGGKAALGIAVSGSYAYLARAGASGTCNATTNTGCELQIYDISNPAAPLYVGGADIGSDNANGIFLRNRYAYLAKDASAGTCSATTQTGCELQIYDVSDPASPAYVGGADTGLAARGLFIRGSLAYVALNASSATCNASTKTGCELQIYNVSDPAAPLYVGGADADTTGSRNVESVSVMGNYAYLVKDTNTSATCSSINADGCEVEIYDVSAPSTPIYAGGADAGAGTAMNLAIANRYIYVAAGAASGTCNATTNTGCELGIYDISAKASSDTGLAAKGGTNVNHAYALSLKAQNSGALWFRGWYNAGSYAVHEVTTPYAYDDGLWHQAVIVHNGSADTRLYVDGALKTSTTAPTSISVANTSLLEIGHYTNLASSYFGGLIDDVRLYNRALADTEITAPGAVRIEMTLQRGTGNLQTTQKFYETVALRGAMGS